MRCILFLCRGMELTFAVFDADVVFTHEGLEILAEHTYIFGRAGYVPLVTGKSPQYEKLFNLFHCLIPEVPF